MANTQAKIRLVRVLLCDPEGKQAEEGKRRGKQENHGHPDPAVSVHAIIVR